MAKIIGILLVGAVIGLFIYFTFTGDTKNVVINQEKLNKIFKDIAEFEPINQIGKVKLKEDIQFNIIKTDIKIDNKEITSIMTGDVILGDNKITGFETVLTHELKEKEGKVFLKTRYVNKVQVKDNPTLLENYKKAINDSVNKIINEKVKKYAVNKSEQRNERKKERIGDSYDNYKNNLSSLNSQQLLKVLSDKLDKEVYRVFNDSPIHDLKEKKSYFSGIEINSDKEIIIELSTFKRIYVVIISFVFSIFAYNGIMYLIRIFTAPKQEEYLIIKK